MAWNGGIICREWNNSPYRSAPPSGLGTGNPETSKSYNIPVQLLLQLMDSDNPALDLKYVDVEEDLVEMGLVGIVEVDEMPMELLTMIGCLGKDGAS